MLTWSLNENEAGGDLVLIETSLPHSGHCKIVYFLFGKGLMNQKTRVSGEKPQGAEMRAKKLNPRTALSQESKPRHISGRQRLSPLQHNQHNQACIKYVDIQAVI